MQLLRMKRSQGDLGIIHFIGIGGIGISGLAEIMYNLGYKVQGSDLVDNSNTKRLKLLGIQIYYSHQASNLESVEYVVVSSAIKRDNIELQTAIREHIPVITRAEMLAEIMKLKSSIGVSGSHGKTTTTCLIASMFENAGLNPTVITGGIINSKATNAYLGSGEYLIAEADESDATFIKVPSSIAVITNIDSEHLDFYQKFDNLFHAFKSFINNLPFYGFAVVCIDHPTVRKLVKSIKSRKIITYGITSEDANVRAFNIRKELNASIFDVRVTLPYHKGTTTIENILLPMPGIHNVLNSLSAITIAAELDFGIKAIKYGFKNFNGIKRRFTKTGEYLGAIVIDDYAHHPKEIIATLKTASDIITGRNGKLIVVYQPHRYSRLKLLFDEFIYCFNLADQLYITEVYRASEQEIQGYNHLTLVDAIRKAKSCKCVNTIDSFEELVFEMTPKVRPNDLIVFLGAGSITNWANDLPNVSFQNNDNKKRCSV